MSIPQSPLGPAGFYADGEGSDGSWPGRTARGRATLERLRALANRGHPDGRGWQELAAANARTPTTLGRFDVGRTARLLHHGFTLTMANTHTILGYPLLRPDEVPSHEELVAMIRS